MVKILEHAKFAMNRELKSKLVNGGLNYSVTLKSLIFLYLPLIFVKKMDHCLQQIVEIKICRKGIHAKNSSRVFHCSFNVSCRRKFRKGKLLNLSYLIYPGKQTA